MRHTTAASSSRQQRQTDSTCIVLWQTHSRHKHLQEETCVGCSTINASEVAITAHYVSLETVRSVQVVEREPLNLKYMSLNTSQHNQE